MKKILTILLTAVMLLCAVLPAFAEGSGFEPAFELEGEEPENSHPAEDEDPGNAAVAEESDPGSIGSAGALSEHGEYAFNESESWIKIGLRYSGSAVEGLSLKSDSGFLLIRTGADGSRTVTDLSDISQLDASRSADEIVLKDKNGSLIAGGIGPDTVILSAAEDEDSRIVSTGSGSYRDGIILQPDGGSLIYVINYVTLEHYLWGVLPNEMGSSYPLEALKAQAVTARSYAVCNLNKHRSYGFDLCSTTDCQVYRGISYESDKTTQACKETAGLVISYKGKAACGYYSSHSGGYTMDCADVWGSDIGYLKAVKDEFTEEHIWNSSISFADLRTRMTASGYDVGEIGSVEVSELCDNGAVYQILVHSSKGEHTISRENLRLVFGSSVIKSQFFSMGPDPEPGIDKEGSCALNLLSEDSNAQVQSLWVMSADGTMAELQAEELYITDGSGAEQLQPSQGTGYSFSHQGSDSGMLYFTGIGSGHGVGMPQSSASNMARAGYDFEEILNYYYTDIEVADYYQL